MKRAETANWDYLTARLHGRRSRIAEGSRLVALCRLTGPPQLGTAVFGDDLSPDAGSLQQRAGQALAAEVETLRGPLGGHEAAFGEWIALRFQLVNLKLCARRVLAHGQPGDPASPLMALPGKTDWDSPPLAAATSLEELEHLLPPESLARRLAAARKAGGEPLQPFFLEAALDQDYFREGLHIASRLPSADRANITALIVQEADTYHAMLALRGRFHHGLAPALLEPWHVEGTRISRRRFNAMLLAPDAAIATSLVSYAVWRTRDPPPAGNEERLAWQQYLKLAVRTFCQARTPLGILVGYSGIRRIEVANLTTLSEGLRLSLSAAALATRMVPPLTREVANA